MHQALNMQGEMFDKNLIMLWSLWRNRNNVLWNDKKQTSLQLQTGGLAWFHEYQQVQPKSSPKKIAQPHSQEMEATGKWIMEVHG